VSSNPARSKLAQVARLGREAEAAEAAGRLEEAVSLLKEIVRLDPGDRRTLHRLGDLHSIRFKRLREAAGYYAAEARCEEREDFQARALALWRLVVRCDPAQLEARERIGALYVALGRVPDARAHYEASARELHAAGLVREAAILRAQLAALANSPPPRAAAAVAVPKPTATADVADDNAVDLAADRLQNGRLFHHYGLHQQARVQLEELLVSFPDHVEGRRLLVEVCRKLEDQEAAADHMRVLTQLMRAQGVAPAAPAPESPPEELPIEEWAGMEEDPMAELLDEIRGDVERVVEELGKKAGVR
jgi:tetratricopeptide (TPR) repeat protein